MAMEGLEESYYKGLKDKSIADVNLETLYTLNKIVYFLHKLHRDNENSQLLLTISGMLGQSLDASSEETNYISPIGKLFENKCWNIEKDELANKDDPELAKRKPICSNPKGGSGPPKK